MRCPDCGHENIAGEETCQGCSASLSSLALPEGKAKRSDQKKILEGLISDLGVHEAIIVSPQTYVSEAVRLMRENKIGCVLIGDEKKLAGICTERDLLMQVAGLQDPGKVRLSSIMTRDPQYLREDHPIAFAFHNMALRQYRHIPILRASGKYGIVSSRDLLRFLCK